MEFQEGKMDEKKDVTREEAVDAGIKMAIAIILILAVVLAGFGALGVVISSVAP